MVEQKESPAPKIYAQWYYEGDKYEYVPFDTISNRTLEESSNKKLPTFQLQVGKRLYEIDLTNNTQRNLKSKRLRQIRRISLKDFDYSHSWYYFKEGPNASKGYEPYSPEQSKILERAYLSKCLSWNLTIGGKPYEINFAKKTQTNIATGYTRTVTRILNDTVITTDGKSIGGNEQIICKICYKNPQNVIFMPCSHLGCCKECAIKSKKCPFCNGIIVKILDCYQP